MGAKGSGRRHVCVKCDEILTLYRQGLSTRAVGARVQYTHQRVVDILQQHGVTRRRPWQR